MSDQHLLIARTPTHNFRVGCISAWKYAQSRFDVATHDGRNTAVTARAFIDGEWTTLEGHLAVRSADDPAYANAPLANNPKTRGTTAHVTVRAADYRKVR